MAEKQAVVSFAKPRNRSNVRKRAQPDDDEEDDTMVVRKDKIQKAALNFTTKKDTAGGKGVVFQYDSSRMVQQSGDQGATKVSEEDTERDRDARALREQVLRQATEGHQDDGTYRGLNNYTDHKKGFRREHNVGAEKGSGLHGPLRGSAHIRTTVRFDYQPDLCKDYKETGYCGYGDACKFVHDRSDYKSGWELDREWDEKQKRIEAAAEEPEGDSEEEDDLPFACYICRKPWAETRDPVVTRCKHYFCERCALAQNAKSNKCAACEQPTNGIFNVATDIDRKVEEQKKKEAEDEEAEED